MADASRVTVDTTADALLTNQAGSYVLRNRGSVAVYIGGSGVADTTGFQLDPGETLSMKVLPQEDVYGITASSSAVVHVLKVEA